MWPPSCTLAPTDDRRPRDRDHTHHERCACAGLRSSLRTTPATVHVHRARHALSAQRHVCHVMRAGCMRARGNRPAHWRGSRRGEVAVEAAERRYGRAGHGCGSHAAWRWRLAHRPSIARPRLNPHGKHAVIIDNERSFMVNLWKTNDHFLKMSVCLFRQK